jgi:hypothetical protein
MGRSIVWLGFAGLVLTALALPSTPPDAAAAGARRPRSCFPPHSRTLAATPHARVFEKHDARNESDYIWGCLKQSATPYLLGTDDGIRDDAREGESIDPIVLRGEYVAYADTFRDHYNNYETMLISRSLRTGRTRHRWHPAPDNCGIRFEVREIELNSRGSIGWLAARSDCGRQTAMQVFKEDRGGGTRLLDAAADDAPLRARRGRIFWRHGGIERSSRLR